MPRFSVIITCYNQISYIREAVDSALGQDYSNREIIVVDDGSTDGSAGLLTQYADRVTVRLLEVNRGAFAARNAGVAIASGDYILFLDGDDLLLPWALSTYSRIIDLRNPKLVIAALLHFRGELNKTPEAPRDIKIVEYRALMKKDRFARFSPTAVMERECFNRSGGWSADMFHLDDHDLLLRLGYAGRTIHILYPLTVGYRMHAGNSIHQLEQMVDAVVKIVQKEKANVYPGGPACRAERYGVIGGFSFYWLKRAIRAGFYARARRLFAVSWSLVLVAIFQRGLIWIRGKRPVETIPFDWPSKI